MSTPPRQTDLFPPSLGAWNPCATPRQARVRTREEGYIDEASAMQIGKTIIGLQRVCPCCKSSRVLRELWDRGSQSTYYCTKCDTIFNGGILLGLIMGASSAVQKPSAT